MPKKEQYGKIEDLPKIVRGVKAIPQEWIDEVQNIPVGHYQIETKLKASTTQGRIRKLQKQGVLDTTFRVAIRQLDNEKRILILHLAEKPQK